MRPIIYILALSLLSACGDDGVVMDATVDLGVVDSGPSLDTGALDASPNDQGVDDRGFNDSGLDAGAPDMGRDGGPQDIGDLDGGPDTGPNDTGLTDTGPTDTGLTDTGSTDTGLTDTGPNDTGPNDTGVDAGPTDTGRPDTGELDTGVFDTGVLDTGVPVDAGVGDLGMDAAIVDTGVDAGPFDSGTPDTGLDAGPADVGSDAGVPSVCGIPPDAQMSFFVTEAGNLSGDFGGIGGADAFCDQAAVAAGIVGRTWRAFLSTTQTDAIARIGTGPWFNYFGQNVGDVFNIAQSPGMATANILTECGRAVIYNAADPFGDPGAHDILTGSDAFGQLQLFTDPNTGALVPATCSDWTSAASTDFGWVGHSDATVGDWIDAHVTFGCDENSLRPSGGNGRVYCFAL